MQRRTSRKEHLVNPALSRLHEIITTLHGKQTLTTYQRKTKGKLNNRIFSSLVIKLSEGGYLVKEEGVGDHWVIWIGLEKKQLLGFKPDKLSHNQKETSSPMIPDSHKNTQLE